MSDPEDDVIGGMKVDAVVFDPEKKTLDVKVTLTGLAAVQYRLAEERRAAREAQAKRDLPCRIFDPDLGVEFRLSGEPHEGEIYRVEVEVVAACAADDGTVLYPFAKPPYSTNEPTCEPELRISVKWDGCSDWRTPCYHTCSRKDLERVSRILVRAYELAGERMGGFEGD